MKPLAGTCPRLVCPRCRRVEAGRLSTAHLRRLGDGLACRRCHARYPIIDGIPIVLADASEWTATTPRDDLMRRALGARTASPLRRYVNARVRTMRGSILDLGCGGGALYDRRSVLGLDVNLAMAQAFAGPALVGDAADPPFPPASVDGLLLLNVLDSCINPPLVLAQADALLRTGGTLLISCAYAWTRAVPEDRRFAPADLVGALTGERAPLTIRGRYRLLDVHDRVRWRLSVSPRLVHEYSCQVLFARKLPA